MNKTSNMETKFKCSVCGGYNVQIKAWVDPNKGFAYCTDIDEPAWCEDCEKEVDLDEVEE